MDCSQINGGTTSNDLDWIGLLMQTPQIILSKFLFYFDYVFFRITQKLLQFLNLEVWSCDSEETPIKSG